MELIDITLEQAIEIIEYLWIWDYNSPEVRYHPWNEAHYSDAYEASIISFKTNNDKEEIYKIHIFTNLDIEISDYKKYCEVFPESNSESPLVAQSRLPNRNSYWIYKRFNEWGLYPKDEAERRDISINNIGD